MTFYSDPTSYCILHFLGIKSPVSNEGEIFTKQEKRIEAILKTHQNNTESVETILQELVQATHNSTFNGTEFIDESCKQFQVISQDQYKRDENKIPKSNSTKSFIELIDFMWKLKRMTDTASADYQEWTAIVRAVAYGSAYGVTLGMVVADFLGCFGNYFIFYIRIGK